jgi:hypothetical protein
MTMMPSLSEATIRAYASPDSYSRARSYYDRGAVVDLVQRGNLSFLSTCATPPSSCRYVLAPSLR